VASVSDPPFIDPLPNCHFLRAEFHPLSFLSTSVRSGRSFGAGLLIFFPFRFFSTRRPFLRWTLVWFFLRFTSPCKRICFPPPQTAIVSSTQGPLLFLCFLKPPDFFVGPCGFDLLTWPIFLPFLEALASAGWFPFCAVRSLLIPFFFWVKLSGGVSTSDVSSFGPFGPVELQSATFARFLLLEFPQWFVLFTCRFFCPCAAKGKPPRRDQFK